MKPVLRRSVALVLAGVAACKGDPTGDLRNGIDQLVATPSVMFLSTGASNTVVVEALDGQGNREATRFSLENVSAGLEVTVDSSFNQVVDNDGNITLPAKATRIRYIVQATAGVGTASFDVSGGGHTTTIDVRVVPASVTATFSDAAPAVGDTVTVTTAAPFSFRSDATVSNGGVGSILVSRTATSIRFIPIPSATPVSATVNGVTLAYAPSLSLNLPTEPAFTTPAAQTGTNALATAPAFAIPATGASRLFLDVGATSSVPQCVSAALGSHPCRVYKITLAAPRTFDMSATWNGTQDMGVYFLNSAGTLTFAPGACDDKGEGLGGQPESCSISLGAGTFYLMLINFSSTDPSWFRLDLTGT